MFKYSDYEDIYGWMDKEGASLLYEYAFTSPQGNALELGTFCGKSLCVIAQALKDKGSGSVISIDRFQNNVKFKNCYADSTEKEKLINNTLNTVWYNLQLRGLDDMVTTVKLDHSVVPERVQGEFSFIYVDGGHIKDRVLQDCIFSWNCLKPGGYLALHDYGHHQLPDVKTVIDMLCKSWDVKIKDRANTTIVIQKPIQGDK